MTALTAGKEASAGIERAARYARHGPEQTLLYQIVQTHTPAFLVALAARERTLPDYVQREFEDTLTCGRLEHGFLRVRCADCHAERLVAFSGKRRGFCPRSGARRMAESAALLVDESFPRLPIRQWVLSVPFALRFLLAREPHVISSVLGIVYRAIARYHGAIKFTWRAESSSTRAGDPRASPSASSDEYAAAPGSAPRGDDRGATPEARIQDGHRDLRNLRRADEGDCQYRRSGGDQAHPGASRVTPVRRNLPRTHRGPRQNSYCPA